MMYAADLHIHTALSPCCDNDMTPNNIVNMAYLKGLDIIAVTDHNSAGNIPAVMECAKSRGILVVPGIEVESREEVHILCYFPDLDTVIAMQRHVYEKLPYIKNRRDIFGEQYIMDENDEITGCVVPLLLGAVDLGLEEIVHITETLGGAAVPAHVDRDANSVISNLGMIPEEAGFKTVELSKRCSREKRQLIDNFIKGYEVIQSSDAHTLADISEREFFLSLDRKDIASVIGFLKRIR